MQHPKPRNDHSPSWLAKPKNRLSPNLQRNHACWHLHVSPVKTHSGDLPGSPMVKTSPSSSGEVPVQSLVRELKSHLPQDQKPKHKRPKNQNVKQEQYCNKFNKDFKNGPHKKKNLKKNKGKWHTCSLKKQQTCNTETWVQGSWSQTTSSVYRDFLEWGMAGSEKSSQRWQGMKVDMDLWKYQEGITIFYGSCCCCC